MTCCDATIVPFDGATLSIPYGAAEILAHGVEPNVQVWIKDGSQYVLSDDMNEVVFTGSSIDIDFGGPAIGVVKIF